MVTRARQVDAEQAHGLEVAVASLDLDAQAIEVGLARVGTSVAPR